MTCPPRRCSKRSTTTDFGVHEHGVSSASICRIEVYDEDCVIVTDGYHPFVAAHGDDAYYLNALAGDRRTMACSFDPDLDWVRDTWASLPADPRVPLVPTAAEPAGA